MAKITQLTPGKFPERIYIHRDGEYYDKDQDGSIVVKLTSGKKDKWTIIVGFIEGTYIEPAEKGNPNKGKQSAALFALMDKLPIAKVTSVDINDHSLVLEVVMDPDNANDSAQVEAKQACKSQRDKHNALYVAGNSGSDDDGDSGDSGDDDGDSGDGSDGDDGKKDGDSGSDDDDGDSDDDGKKDPPPPPKKQRAADEDLLGRKHGADSAISRDEADDIILDVYRNMGYSEDEIKKMLNI